VIHEVTLQSYFNPTTFNARQQKPNVRKTLDTTFYMGWLQGLASMERTTAGSSASLGMTDLRS
jgi:hypothetical protein